MPAHTPASAPIAAAEPHRSLATRVWMPVALLAVAWLYVWLWIEPPLRYYRSAPPFLLHTDFFSQHLKRPGGLLDYAAAWLAQLDCRAPLGALAIVTLAGLVGAGAQIVFGRGGASILELANSLQPSQVRPPQFRCRLPCRPLWTLIPVAALVPAWLLLALAGQYDFPVQAVGLGVGLAVWSLAAWQVGRPGLPVLRGIALGLVGTLLGYVAGPVPVLLFAALAGVWEGAATMNHSVGQAFLPAGSPGFQARRRLGRLESRPNWQTGMSALRTTGSWRATRSLRTCSPAMNPVGRGSRRAWFASWLGWLGSSLAPPGTDGSWEGRTTSPGSALLGALAPLLGLGSVLATAAVPLGSVLPRWGAGLPLVAAAIMHLWLPMALWLATRHRQMGAAPAPATASAARRPEGRVAAGTTAWLRGFGWRSGAALLVAGVGVLMLTFDSSGKALAQVEWNAQAGRWDAALAAARRLEAKPNPATRLAIHRALFHQGRLTDDLFTFAQQKGDDVLPSLRDGMRICTPLSDTLLELGQVNLAEHFAHEALETAGERPHLLWQLARINVLLDRPRAARVFLNRLRQVPFHRQEAGRWLRALETDPTLATDPAIARLRLLRVTTDQPESHLPTEVLLEQLLQGNRHNRMAFEYLLAHYLLTDQPAAVVRRLESLDESGSWKTPRHVAEAIVWFLAQPGNARAELGGRLPDAGTVRRFQELQARLSQNGGRVTGLETQLAREFGDTFWFYHLFGATFGGAPPAFTQTAK